ncbi:MAG: NAD-dependent protein deacetylase [Planctomycetes bacterium]|nr:NAD-dependent protein deacetylase [Planctomycetota bacterium]
MSEIEADLSRAADAVKHAHALLIGAGAGMGVDSGLPDFRGDEGFWKAYPAFRHLGASFVDMANPRWFRDDPHFAWGFYGHRRNLYRETTPHAGFQILARWAEGTEGGSFVFTSNVDGQFQRAGFDPERVDECHGAIDFSQCLADCGAGIFPGGPERIEIDEATMRASDPLPRCPRCEGLARPNILMFGDWNWEEGRQIEQQRRLARWWNDLEGRRVVVIEIGAGGAIPTVRSFCQRTAGTPGCTLIRINPREPDVARGQIGLPLGAKEALEAIDALL